MDGSAEWSHQPLVDFECKDDELSLRRRCPNCLCSVTGRPNKIFCSANCRKRYNEGRRNSALSVSKRRENTELFDRANRLTEMLYQTPPLERLGFMKDLIDQAREGNDAQLRDILSNWKLTYLNKDEKIKYLHRKDHSYCTISQAAARYCRKFWRASVRDVVYCRVATPPTGLVESKASSHI